MSTSMRLVDKGFGFQRRWLWWRWVCSGDEERHGGVWRRMNGDEEMEWSYGESRCGGAGGGVYAQGGE
ncbi:hypothetical protein Tco_0525315 [Tanacetum coccineum]